MRAVARILLATVAGATVACRGYDPSAVRPAPLTALRARPTDSSGIISGIVRDNGAPLPGTVVTIPGSRAAAVSNDSGRFRIVAPPGEFTLLSRRIGYESRLDTLRLAEGRGVELVLTLTPRVLKLTECFFFTHYDARSPWRY